MSLNTSLRRGDWVVASSTSGSQIVGQVQNDMLSLGGSAFLRVLVGGDLNSKRDASDKQTITINVNFWTVTLFKPNNLVDEG